MDGAATTWLGYYNTAQVRSNQWISIGALQECSPHVFTNVNISIYCADNPIKVGDKVGIDLDFFMFPVYPFT